MVCSEDNKVRRMAKKYLCRLFVVAVCVLCFASRLFLSWFLCGVHRATYLYFVRARFRLVPVRDEVR